MRSKTGRKQKVCGNRRSLVSKARPGAPGTRLVTGSCFSGASMALKIKFTMPTGTHGWGALALRVVLIAIAAGCITVLSVGGYFYFKYKTVVDARLKEPLFKNTAKIFAEPREVRPGQKMTVRLIAEELRQAGYTTGGAQK